VLTALASSLFALFCGFMFALFAYAVVAVILLFVIAVITIAFMTTRMGIHLDAFLSTSNYGQ